MKTVLMLFYIRLNIAFFILFKPSRSWYFVEIDKENMGRLFNDLPFATNTTYHRLTPYVNQRILKRLVVNEDTEILMKAAFNAEAEMFWQKTK